jgi:hypothetical protein
MLALDLLVEEGYATRTKHGQTYIHEHARPYLEVADMLGGTLINEGEEP